MSEMDYLKAHYKISAIRGKASEQVCVSCGEQAREWAYQYTSEPTEPRQYSLDPKDYEPMCVGCHNRFDMEKDPTLLERYRANGRLAWTRMKDRLATDPEFASSVETVLLDGRTAMLEKRRADPEWSFQANSAGGKIGGRRAISLRRKCNECEMIAAPPHLGTHQKAKGHTGWEAV